MRPLLALALTCVAIAAPAHGQQKPELDLVDFFSGRTHGQGTIKKALQRPHRIVIDTVGRRGSNGELILIDTIKEEGEATKVRRWVMRPAGPNAFAGSISDAVGPVRVDVEGASATIRYRMKGGIAIQQVLTLRDAKTLSSRVTGKKLGVRVATMEGTIRKVD